MTRRQRRMALVGTALLLGLVVAIHVARPALGPWLGGTASALEKEDAPILASRPELVARASVTPQRAWEIARRSEPGSVPAHGTLTVLGGKLVYVLAFERTGHPAGEVIVDARTGAVLSDREAARRPR